MPIFLRWRGSKTSTRSCLKPIWDLNSWLSRSKCFIRTRWTVSTKPSWCRSKECSHHSIELSKWQTITSQPWWSANTKTDSRFPSFHLKSWKMEKRCFTAGGKWLHTLTTWWWESCGRTSRMAMSLAWLRPENTQLNRIRFYQFPTCQTFNYKRALISIRSKTP